MSATPAIHRLERSLAELDESLAELALIAGDLPETEDEPAIVEAIRERADDIRGELRQATNIAHGAAAATVLWQAARSLAACHQACNDAARRIRNDLAPPASSVEVAAVAAARGGGWARWSAVVQQALDRCAAGTDSVATALLDCWRELLAHPPLVRT